MAGAIEQGPRLPRDLMVTPMQDTEHLVLQGAHPLLLVHLGVVVAEQMKRAVDAANN